MKELCPCCAGDGRMIINASIVWGMPSYAEFVDCNVCGGSGWIAERSEGASGGSRGVSAKGRAGNDVSTSSGPNAVGGTPCPALSLINGENG